MASTADTATWVRTVRSSHDRFAGLVTPLSGAEVEGRSYATEWTIADTASHLGSQAEIFDLFLGAGLAGEPAPGVEAFRPVWARWDALPPLEQVRRSVAANEAFVARVEELPDEQGDRFSLAAFGTDVDLAGLMGLRLGELALHTWDIAVALDATATVTPGAVDLLVDQLPRTAARAGRASDGVEPVVVVTTDPERTFVLEVGDPVALRPSTEAGPDALVLPAEALVRLVYGRLDADHTPSGVSDPRLEVLRRTFPGF